jgi:hypothetical protein
MGEHFSLSPAERGARPKAGDYLFRAATCYVKAAGDRSEPGRVAKALYRDDPVTPIILKAAVPPARTDNAAWAGALAAQATSGLLQAIVSLSAAADLLVRALRIDFAGYASVRLPGRVTQPGQAVWVGEGMPIPVKNFPLNTVTLKPHKFAVITSYTNEIASSSNVEQVVRSMLSEASAIELDRALFSATADDGVTPGGLLHGVTPIAASTGTGTDAMTADISALVGALGAAYAGLDPVFVAAPGQAAALKFWAGDQFDYPVLPSAALPPGTVIAIEPASLAASITDALPEFETSQGVLLHFEDTTPTDIVAGTAAVPNKSMFQTDAVALRMILRNVSWAMRVAGHVAFVQGVTW